VQQLVAILLGSVLALKSLLKLLLLNKRARNFLWNAALTKITHSLPPPHEKNSHHAGVSAVAPLAVRETCFTVLRIQFFTNDL
jgi:hypothetical protein